MDLVSRLYSHLLDPRVDKTVYINTVDPIVPPIGINTFMHFFAIFLAAKEQL